MRTIVFPFLAGLIFACATPQKPVPAPPVEVTVAEVAPEPEPEPEPIPEPEPPANADMTVSLTWANGETKSGHVKRIERSSDWYGEKEWYTADNRLTITTEAPNGQESEPTWGEITSITVKPGNVKNADCAYESDYMPWMYTCEVRNKGTAKLKSGKSSSVTSRYKWRFTFDDGTQTEFWLYKHAARMQDGGNVEFGMDMSENPSIYQQLQQDLREDLKRLLTNITVQ